MTARKRKPGPPTRKPQVDDAIASRYRPGKRRCLRCRQEFESTWAGHRLCETCTRYASETA